MRSIRSAAEADWPSVWSIISQVAATGHSYFLETDISEAAAKEYWMGPGLSAYVADDDGEIVGTYTLKANHRGLGAHVANAGYMVRPGLDGRGIGFQLAEHSLAEARAAGFQAMQFNAVVSTNHRAIALWQRLGFSVVGTVPKAFRHLEHGLVDLHIMHRFLQDKVAHPSPLAPLEALSDLYCMQVRDAHRLLTDDGWFLARTRGSHQQYKHPTKPGIVTVAGHPGDELAPGTLNSILKQAGLKS